MSTETLTLTDFLLARIGEDEAVAQMAGAGHYVHPRDVVGVWRRDCPGCLGVVPQLRARVLAECEAKRRIVEHCRFDHLTLSPGDPYVLQLLALPYADHEDFREAWNV